MSEHQNRQPEGVPTGGQYATTSKPDAAVSLDVPLGRDGELTAAELQTALNQLGQRGQATQIRRGTVEWRETDEVTGTTSVFEVEAEGLAVAVADTETDARHEIYCLPPDSTKTQVAQSVVRALDSARALQRDIRATNAALAEYVTPSSHADLPAGTLTFRVGTEDETVFGPFEQRSEWTGQPYLPVRLGHEYYEIESGADASEVVLRRSDDGQELNRWESAGILAHLDTVTGHRHRHHQTARALLSACKVATARARGSQPAAS